LLKREIEYRGLSVVIAARECKETLQRKARAAAAQSQTQEVAR